jgi:hypothetical protein
MLAAPPSGVGIAARVLEMATVVATVTEPKVTVTVGAGWPDASAGSVTVFRATLLAKRVTVVIPVDGEGRATFTFDCPFQALKKVWSGSSKSRVMTGPPAPGVGIGGFTLTASMRSTGDPDEFVIL